VRRSLNAVDAALLISTTEADELQYASEAVPDLSVTFLNLNLIQKNIKYIFLMDHFMAVRTKYCKIFYAKFNYFSFWQTR
jgi:predicted LPLAT superfamily acyltransferase